MSTSHRWTGCSRFRDKVRVIAHFKTVAVGSLSGGRGDIVSTRERDPISARRPGNLHDARLPGRELLLRARDRIDQVELILYVLMRNVEHGRELDSVR